MFYSKSTGGFHVPELHGDSIPEDAVEITVEQHAKLLSGQSSGKQIQADETGFPVLVDPPELTLAEIEAQKLALVQKHMDDAARTYCYDDIKTACTYADEPAVPKFQAEGQAFRAWRSLVWAKCYAMLEEVNSGSREIPTDQELISELPVLNLPAQ